MLDPYTQEMYGCSYFHSTVLKNHVGKSSSLVNILKGQRDSPFVMPTNS